MTITGGRGAVRGTVRDGDGNPVNLATVRISESGQQATTNASGFYQIVDVPVGDGSALTLIASKTGVASDAATFNVCPGQTVDVSPRLIQGIGLIRTTVLAECDNVPLNGAVMTVQSTGQTGTADALGQLSIPDVPSGTQTLVTTKSNFTGDTRTVAVPLGTALNVGTIRLPGGRAVITGTVVDANNAPVSSAAVSVNVAFGTTFTNGAGQFTLQVPANTSTTGYTLEVTKQDYSTLTRATQRFCDGTTNIGTLTLQKPVTTGTLTGIVRTCDTGEGVTGATVEISSTSGFQVSSGSGGRFTIPNVPPGSHTLRVLKNGFDSRDYGPFTLAAGQTLDVGTFLLCAHTTTSEIQIELTWGTGANLPRDLDLHMSGPLQQFDPGRYHLWFREPVDKNCVATLGPQDSNNADGGGPERITIRQSYGLDPFTNVADCESTDLGGWRVSDLGPQLSRERVRRALVRQLRREGRHPTQQLDHPHDRSSTRQWDTHGPPLVRLPVRPQDRRHLQVVHRREQVCAGHQGRPVLTARPRRALALEGSARRRGCQHAEADRLCDGFRAIRDAETGDDPLDVRLGRPGAHAKRDADLPIGLPIRDESEHFVLTSGQPRSRPGRRLDELMQRPGRQLSIQDDLAGQHPA